MKKSLYYMLNIITYILFFASFWAIDTYGNFSGDELFFHLLVPLGGISTQSFESLAISVFLPGIFLGLLIAIILERYLPKKKVVISIILFLIFLTFALNKINIFTYIYDQINESKFIKENYVNPKDVELVFPKNKKNLIYIFLESMENTYSNTKNGGNKEKNLIPNLTKLSKENTSFSNTNKLGGALQINGTAWTAAAMIGQTSGLPLKINTSSNGIIDLANSFEGTITLGNILEDNGYKNYLLLGSDSSYGHRKEYFLRHGNYQIYDLNTAIEEKKMTEEDIVWWGFDDTDLYNYAKEQLTKISKENQPFNYTMLTVDTHFEDGYLDETCKKNFHDQYSNVISCADEKIYEFIIWLKEQDFYEDTTIILVGDHLSMDTDYFSINNDYVRTTYNVIINSNTSTTNTTNRKFTSLDMFPTALAALDIKIKGNRLGLGTNLYSKEKTIVELYGYDYVSKELNKRSSFYNNNFLSYR